MAARGRWGVAIVSAIAVGCVAGPKPVVGVDRPRDEASLELGARARDGEHAGPRRDAGLDADARIESVTAEPDDEECTPPCAERCDGRDQDGDGAIDEGVLAVGAAGTLFEGARPFEAPLIVRHARGYLVIASGRARWLDDEGRYASAPFALDPAPVGPVAALAEGERVLLAYAAERDVIAVDFTIGAHHRRGDPLRVIDAPTDPEDPLVDVHLVAAGDRVVAVATYAQDDFGRARAGVLDPRAWRALGVVELDGANHTYGVMAVDGDTLLVSVSVEQGLALWGRVHRLHLGALTFDRAAMDLGPGGFLELPRSATGETLAFLPDHDTGASCASRFDPSTLTLGACAPLESVHLASAVRGGVVSVLVGGGVLTELPLAPGTEGSAPLDLGIGRAPAALAVHEGGGVIVSVEGDRVVARALGCAE